MSKTTLNLVGGLGNQLFQIFFLLSIGKKFGIDVYFPDTFWLDKKRHTYYKLFPTIIKSNEKNEPYIYCQEPPFPTLLLNLDNKNNYYFNGYFQSYLYLTEIDPYEYIKIPEEDRKEIADTLTTLHKNKRPLVSLHVRRGDYLLVQHYHNILGVSYYKNAIKILKEYNINDPIFVIFSDDIQWCKDNFSFLKDKEFISTKDYTELFLMSKCDHNIIANSSFSWWGAYLNTNRDKKVIYPSKWFEVGINTTNLCPLDWIKCNVL